MVVLHFGWQAHCLPGHLNILFVKVNLIVKDTEEGLVRQKMAAHLKDLISDAQLYTDRVGITASTSMAQRGLAANSVTPFLSSGHVA